MKVCKSCKVVKKISEFYVDSRMKDGHLNQCKDCVKNRIKKHRCLNIDQIREYEKKRGNLQHRVDARREYRQTDAGKAARRTATATYNKRHPMRYAARVITRKSVRDGKLVKLEKCSECESTNKIEGHHDDYTKPLEVRWLCEACHKQWHKVNKPIYE